MNNGIKKVAFCRKYQSLYSEFTIQTLPFINPDHIMIGDNKYFNLAFEGLIEEYNMKFFDIKRAKRKQ